jgi:hypothetical protein
MAETEDQRQFLAIRIVYITTIKAKAGIVRNVVVQPVVGSVKKAHVQKDILPTLIVTRISPQYVKVNPAVHNVASAKITPPDVNMKATPIKKQPTTNVTINVRMIQTIMKNVSVMNKNMI